MSNTNCHSSQKSLDSSEKWKCGKCNNIFHVACVRPNENIQSWSCPSCKFLRAPPPPKSRKSSKKSCLSEMSKTAEVELEMIEEESKLLAKHRKQKEKFLAEAEQTLREQQVKELELLQRKSELIKTLSERGSSRSISSSAIRAKVNNWKTADIAIKKAIPIENSTVIPPTPTVIPSTTTQCNITPAENIDRLSSSLIGRAYEAVKFKLLHPDNLDGILSTLKRIFGRDELVLNSQIQEMRALKPRIR